MSGFAKSNRKSDLYSFANIIGGTFHVQSTKENPEAVSRVNKNNKEVFEIITDELQDVFLHDVMVQQTDYGKNLSITTRSHEDSKDENNKFFVINCALNSGYAYSFLNRVKSIDLEKPLTLKVFEIENKGEDQKIYKSRTLGIYQNEKMIDKIWTKENNPVPKLVLIVDKKGNPVLKAGKQQWDDSERVEFLQSFIENEVTPEIRELSGSTSKDQPKASVSEVDSEEHISDDLPF